MPITQLPEPQLLREAVVLATEGIWAVPAPGLSREGALGAGVPGTEPGGRGGLLQGHAQGVVGLAAAGVVAPQQVTGLQTDEALILPDLEAGGRRQTQGGAAPLS